LRSIEDRDTEKMRRVPRFVIGSW